MPVSDARAFGCISGVRNPVTDPIECGARRGCECLDSKLRLIVAATGNHGRGASKQAGLGRLLRSDDQVHKTAGAVNTHGLAAVEAAETDGAGVLVTHARQNWNVDPEHIGIGSSEIIGVRS